MPSPPRSRSPSRFSTSGLAALLLVAAVGATACGDDDSCGPGDDEAPGLRVDEIVFDGMVASPNNDCPPTAGEHPTAITIQGTQVEPEAPGQFLVFCLPRPDLIDGEAVSLTDSERIEVVDLFGRDGAGCELRFDRSAAPGSGSVTFSGFCDNGIDGAGFAMSLTGVLPFTRTCDGEDPTAVTVELGGRAAVSTP
jgi:hypothetical protein